ncbi:MAG TPA: DUF3352 domain-containing protein [Solirubrobacterales bacterium]
MSSRRSLVLASALGVLGFSACGGDEASGPASFVPADSPLYIEARVQPTDEQRSALEELAGRFTELPIVGEVADPFDLLEQELDRAASDAGVDFSFSEDVEPWLGEWGAMAASAEALAQSEGDEADQGFVFALEVSDADAARDALTRFGEGGEDLEVAEFAGVEGIAGDDLYAAVVDEALIAAPTEEDFQAALDANDGDSLGDSDGFDEAFGELDAGEAIARAYVDFGAVMEATAEAEGEFEDLEIVRGLIPELDGPIGAALFVRDHGVTLDVSAPGEAAGSAEALRAVSADAVAAIGIADLGARLRDGVARIERIGAELGEFSEGQLASAFQGLTGVSLDDAAAALGDGVLELQGQLSDAFAVQLRVDADDGGTVESLLNGLQNFLEADESTRVGPPLAGDAGFSAQPRGDAGEGSPIKFIGAETDGETVTATVASDIDEARAAMEADGEALADDPGFQAAAEALGDGFEPSAFARPGALLESVLGGASALDIVTGGSLEDAIPGFLAGKLSWLAAGMRGEGERVVTRIVVGVE